MKSIQNVIRVIAVGLLLTGASAQAATITGTVTDKTTGKPAAGDTVVLVDVQAGMSEAAKATTDARGHYSLNKPGSSNYLVRVIHQGATYFIGAPEGNAAGDITVYDVAAKVEGIGIDEDVLGLVETVGGQLRVIERYAVHNASSPPRTQWSQRAFEIVLPEGALVESVSAQRPGGLQTSLKMDPDGPKGHYSFNFPIQPDNADKGTLFQIEYELPYSGGKFTFHPQLSIPARTVWVMMPKSMTFAAGAGSNFQSSPQDPEFQTFVARNVMASKALEFTVSGNGSMPRDDQSAQGGQQTGNGGQEPGAVGMQPGGGIGTPINTPDPLSKYKGWILGGVALLLFIAAGFLLRKPAAGAVLDTGAAQTAAAPATKNAALLNVFKEELFALESEKIAGTLAPAEYSEMKAALETVLRRALKRP